MNCFRKISLYALEKIKVMYNVSEKCPHLDVIFFGKLSDSDVNSKKQSCIIWLFQKKNLNSDVFFGKFSNADVCLGKISETDMRI